MATSADGFGISCAFYFGVMIIVFLLFAYFRRLSWTRKFYAKKCYNPPPGCTAPPVIQSGAWWPKSVITCAEAQVLASGGMDALIYLKTMRFSLDVFLMVTFVVSAIILPINLVGDNVDNLTSNPYDPAKISQYIEFYLPGINGTSLEEEEKADQEAVKVIEAPEIYNKSIPPPPPGLLWWERLPNIPPLPPVTVLGPEYENYTWIYDENYKVVQYDLTELDKTTMTNIPTRSNYLYAHAIVTWVVTILVLWRLKVYCRQALNLRLLFFKESGGVQTRSILCTDIPVTRANIAGEEDAQKLSWLQKKIQRSSVPHQKTKLIPNDEQQSSEPVSTLDRDVDVVLPDRWEEASQKILGRPQDDQDDSSWIVQHEFRNVYKGEYLESQMVYDTNVLTKLCNQYENIKSAAYHSIDVTLSKYMDPKKKEKMKKQSKKVVGVTMGQWGTEKYGKKPKTVDTFEFYIDRLEYLRSEILKEQELAREKPFPSSFVSFKTRKAQVVASQTMMSEDLSTWVCQAAPHPKEVLWGNLRMRSLERNIRNKIFTASFWALMLFYMIPVSAVQVLISTNSLVGFLQTIPIASALLTGILPGLALRIFMIILPMILTAMLKAKGVISGSELDLGLVSYMYIFEFITVFLGTFIAGTFANQFEQLLDDPGSIVSIFGTAAPQVGIFFMTYILVQACWELPFDIFDVVGLVLYHLKLKIAATKKAKERIDMAKVTFSYGSIIPDDSIIFLLGLSFSIACPLIAPTALIYFGTRYLVNKYKLVYRAEENYQSGGQGWLRVFDQYITSLIAFQILMIFILAIKEMIGPPIIVLPLPFITLFWGLSTKGLYTMPMKYQSLLMAEDQDRQDGEASVATEEEIKGSYQNPVFIFDEEDHQTVISQCSVIKQAQDSESWPNYEPMASLIQVDDLGDEDEPFHDIEST